jgi:quinol monooxygenase YgiN
MPRGILFVLSLVLLVTPLAVGADDENPVVTFVKTKVREKEKPFGMTVAFKVKEGSEKAFAEAFKPCVAGSRKEPGCLGYFFNQDVDDPRTFVVFERFKSIAALENHAKSQHVADLLKIIGPLLDGDPTAKVYSIVGE